MWRLVYTSVFAGLAFGLAMGVFLVPAFFLVGQFIVGVYASVAAGVLFALGMGWFAYSAEEAFRSYRVALNPGETLIHEGPANHFVGKEAAGGWLRLTNQRLFFDSHGMNYFVHGWDAPLAEVLGVSLCLTYKLVPNGIRVSTSQGTRQFVVANRRHWKQCIENALDNLPTLQSQHEALSEGTRMPDKSIDTDVLSAGSGSLLSAGQLRH
jgi:hypothetical protein